MWVWIIALAWALPAAALKAQVRVETGAQGIDLEARVGARATPEQALALLRDYASLSQYMPNVDSCYVVAQTDSSVLVRQVVTSRLILPWTFHFLLEMVEEGQILRFRQVEGNMRSYRGEWRAEPTEGGVAIVYRAHAEHRWRLPRILMAWVVRRQAESMLPVLALELERRAGRGQ